MERVVSSNYTMLEYNTIISIIHNVIIGLDSYKNYDYLEADILRKAEEHINILTRYYNILKRNVNFRNKEIILNNEELRMIKTVFMIEYSYKETTYNIWKKEITDGNLDVVHMCRDYDDISYLKDIIINKKYRAISNSLVTDETKTYANGESSFGIVYEFNYDAFLGACEADAQLEHTNYDRLYTNKNNIFTVKGDKLLPINSEILTYTDNYQMTLTKTPYNLLNPSGINVDTYYNEIGLDKLYTMPLKIIYYEDLNPDIEYMVSELAAFLNIAVEKKNSKKVR